MDVIVNRPEGVYLTIITSWLYLSPFTHQYMDIKYLFIKLPYYVSRKRPWSDIEKRQTSSNVVARSANILLLNYIWA